MLSKLQKVLSLISVAASDRSCEHQHHFRFQAIALRHNVNCALRSADFLATRVYESPSTRPVNVSNKCLAIAAELSHGLSRALQCFELAKCGLSQKGPGRAVAVI